MRIKAIAFSALVVLVLASLSLGQTEARRPAVSIALAPPFIEKATRPNNKLTDTISLTNNGTVPVIVSVDFADFRVSRDGHAEELPPGTDVSSLAPYLRIEPLKLRVAPQGRAFFRYTVNAPAAFKQLRSQIFFSSKPVVANAPNQVLFVPRMGVPLYVENLAAKPASIKVDRVKWSRSVEKRGMLNLEMLVTNEGERNIRPRGFVEVRSVDGKFSRTFPFNQGNEPLLPAQRRVWSLPFGPVPGGELSIRLRFETSTRTSFDRAFQVTASGG